MTDDYAGQAGLTAGNSDRNAHGLLTDHHLDQRRTTVGER